MGFSFHRPETIDAAIAFAHEHGEAARFLAGGTDLIIQINRGRLAPRHLISLAGLGLDTISETPTEYVIGAMATHDAVVTHPGFQKQLIALTEASAVIGGRQVRNVATVGGNIVNASPAADLVPVLLSLDATVESARPGRHARLAARSLPAGTRSHRARGRRDPHLGPLRQAAGRQRDGVPQGGTAKGHGDLGDLRRRSSGARRQGADRRRCRRLAHRSHPAGRSAGRAAGS